MFLFRQLFEKKNIKTKKETGIEHCSNNRLIQRPVSNKDKYLKVIT